MDFNLCSVGPKFGRDKNAFLHHVILLLLASHTIVPTCDIFVCSIDMSPVCRLFTNAAQCRVFVNYLLVLIDVKGR